MLIMINFTFGHNVFKSSLLLLHQNASAGGKGIYMLALIEIYIVGETILLSTCNIGFGGQIRIFRTCKTPVIYSSDERSCSDCMAQSDLIFLSRIPKGQVFV